MLQMHAEQTERRCSQPSMASKGSLDIHTLQLHVAGLVVDAALRQITSYMHEASLMHGFSQSLTKGKVLTIPLSIVSPLHIIYTPKLNLLFRVKCSLS